MEHKNFTDLSDAELWFDFKAAEQATAPEHTDTIRKLAGPGDLLLDVLFGDTWCCRVARRFERVQAPDGILLRMHFCPRCGRKLQRR
jgi:hypothetical protein